MLGGGLKPNGEQGFTPAGYFELAKKLYKIERELRRDGGVTHPRPAIAGRHHAKLQAAWKDAYPRFESFATEPK